MREESHSRWLEHGPATLALLLLSLPLPSACATQMAIIDTSWLLAGNLSQRLLWGALLVQGVIIVVLCIYLLRSRKAQQESKENEKLFENLFAKSQDALYVTYRGVLTHVNEACARMFGVLAPEELLQQPAETLLAEQARRQHPSAQRAERYQTQGLRRDGTTFPMEVRTSTYSSTDTGYTLAILRDITTERRAQELLRDSQRQRDLAVQAGRMGTWRWDVRTRQASWSATNVSLFGLEPDITQDLNHLLEAMVHPEDREQVRNALTTSFANSADHYVEYRVIWPDQTEHWLASQGCATLDEQGNPTGLTGVCWDITGRKHAEEALRANEEKFRGVYNESTIGIAVIDTAGHYLMVNPALCHMLGYSEDELRRRTFWDVTHPDDLQNNLPEREQLLAGTLPRYRLEKRYISRQGDTIWANVHISTLKGEDGKPDSELVLVENISSRKLNEEAFARYARELARSNAELQQFAYVVSHDLQEPLRTISSFMQLLERRLQIEADSPAAEYMAFIVDAVARMHALIRDLLAFSRVVNSATKPPTQVEMEGIIEMAKLNLHASLETSGAVVTVESMPVVQGQETQLLQLLQNLIGNALKYRSAAAPQVHIRAQREGAEWVFAVQDNGIGIDPRFHERIFGVFKRLHGPEVPGTGIGLALCQKIVEQHGGRIWVDSQAGQGATFYFTLPAIQTEASPAEAEPS